MFSGSRIYPPLGSRAERSPALIGDRSISADRPSPSPPKWAKSPCKLLIRYFLPTSMATKQELRRRGLIDLACLVIVACILIATMCPPSCSTSPCAQIADSSLIAGCRRCRLAERVIAEARTTPAPTPQAMHDERGSQYTATHCGEICGPAVPLGPPDPEFVI